MWRMLQAVEFCTREDKLPQSEASATKTRVSRTKPMRETATTIVPRAESFVHGCSVLCLRSQSLPHCEFHRVSRWILICDHQQIELFRSLPGFWVEKLTGTEGMVNRNGSEVRRIYTTSRGANSRNEPGRIRPWPFLPTPAADTSSGASGARELPWTQMFPRNRRSRASGTAFPCGSTGSAD
jgi:hypothetical protein